MVNRFTDKVVLITGSARGQGANEGRAFLAEGAHVVFCDILDDLGTELVGSLGERASYEHLDVTDEADWARIAERIGERHGRVDVLVNNAGIAHRFGIMDTDPRTWQKILDVNLTGPYLGMRAIAPLMTAAGGSVINISSIAGLTGHLSSAYAASKWGLRGLSKTAALEFAPVGIRVNSVHPGLVETPIVADDTAFPDALISLTPLGRTGYPRDVEPLVLFLASDDAGFITGEEFVVDGGLTSLGVFSEVVKRIKTPH